MTFPDRGDGTSFVGTGSNLVRGAQALGLLRGETVLKNTPAQPLLSSRLSEVSKLNSSQDVALYQNFHGVALHSTSQIPVEGYLVFVQESMANRDRFCAMYTDDMIPNLRWADSPPFLFQRSCRYRHFAVA